MYKIRWWRTFVGQPEIDGVVDAIKHERISQGTVTAELEEAFAKALNVPYAVATTSGSAALLMASLTLGIGHGDEVIVPNRTFIATAHAPLMLGAKIVLVDTLPDLPLMDPDQVRKKITKKTKAIMPVHLNGRSVNMREINRIAKKHGIFVIEDAAQAIFSKNADGYLGTQSDIGCFSLGMAKLVSTGQGGMVVTRNKKLYEKLKLIRTHGVVDTEHDPYTMMGFNLKFNDVLASIGIVQLGRGPEKISHVNKIYNRYAKVINEFPFIKLIPVDIAAGEVPVWTEVLCRDRKKFIDYMESNGIEIRPLLPNLHRSAHLKNKGAFPNSQKFEEQGLFLPCGPAQPMENVEKTIVALRSYKEKEA